MPVRSRAKEVADVLSARSSSRRTSSFSTDDESSELEAVGEEVTFIQAFAATYSEGRLHVSSRHQDTTRQGWEGPSVADRSSIYPSLWKSKHRRAHARPGSNVSLAGSAIGVAAHPIVIVAHPAAIVLALLSLAHKQAGKLAALPHRLQAGAPERAARALMNCRSSRSTCSHSRNCRRKC